MNHRHALISLIAVAAGGMFRAEGDAGSGSTADSASAPAAPPAPNDYVTMVKQNFHFKKEKDVLAEDGKTVLEAGKKHPTVEMYLPVPKRERLIQILQNPEAFPKENELINAAVFDVIYNVARGQINEFREKDPKATVTPAVLDLDKLDFTAIANTPKAERGAYAPSDEELKTFLDSYLEVMPAATGKTEAQIKNHITLFQSGFKKQRNQKEILELFAGMLQVYLSKAPTDAVEENLQVVEYFTNKLDRWLKAEEKITMDML